MTKSYVIDLFSAGSALRTEIEHFLIQHADLAEMFPNGVPDLIDCLVCAVEVFEAKFESALHWHPDAGNDWIRIEQVLRDRLGTRCVDHPDYLVFEEEVLVPSMINAYSEFLNWFLRKRRWHRFELRRSGEVQTRRSKAGRRLRPHTALTIVDLGDHRILHYHETVEQGQRVSQNVDDPIEFSMATRRLQQRDIRLQPDLVSDDPYEVNRYLNQNTEHRRLLARSLFQMLPVEQQQQLLSVTDRQRLILGR